MTSTMDYSQKIAILSDSEAVKTMNNQYKGKYEFKFLKEKLYTTFVGLEQGPMYFLSEAFSDQIPAFVESGLLNYWIANHLKRGVGYRESKTIAPAVLTLDHLSAGFQLILLMISLSIICFIAEFFPIVKMYFIWTRILRAYISISMFEKTF
jgi:hypothetical protein